MHHHMSGYHVISDYVLPITQQDCEDYWNEQEYYVRNSRQRVKLEQNGVKYFQSVIHGHLFENTLKCTPGNGDWKIETTYSSYPVSGAVVTDEYWLEMEQFTTKVVHQRVKLPAGKIGGEKKQTGFDSALGRWFFKKDYDACENKLEQVYKFKDLSLSLWPTFQLGL